MRELEELAEKIKEFFNVQHDSSSARTGVVEQTKSDKDGATHSECPTREEPVRIIREHGDSISC